MERSLKPDMWKNLEAESVKEPQGKVCLMGDRFTLHDSLAVNAGSS